MGLSKGQNVLDFGCGTGNYAIPAAVIVGRENIIVVGTKDKLSRLDCLRVDTGDVEADGLLHGPMEVTVGNLDKNVFGPGRAHWNLSLKSKSSERDS